MTAPRGYYLGPGVGERECRDEALDMAELGETSILHRHRYGDPCRPTCETIEPKPKPVALPPRSTDVGHSIVIADGHGWAEADVPTMTIP